MFLVRPMALVFAIVLTALPAPVLAGGWWSCDTAANWQAVGQPAYPPPLRHCGPKPIPPLTEARCVALGGHWGPIGIFPVPVCRMPTADAGRVCGDVDECESTCLAKLSSSEFDRVQAGVSLPRLGRCAPVTPVLGCLALVKAGVVDTLLCLD